jgi:hypothetical protein
MRKALAVSLVCLAFAGVAAAQDDGRYDPAGQANLNRSNDRSGQNGQSRGNGQGQQGHENPAPPPIPRCADLAVTSLGFVSSIPGQAPLAAGEVALQYDVHNAGTSMYVAPSGASQALVLEYTTPSGVHQVATMPLSPRGAASGATPASAGGVTLAEGASWRGYMRFTLPAEARRWPLRLKLSFAQSASPYAARISDCDPDNDQVVVPRSQLPPLPAQPPS